MGCMGCSRLRSLTAPRKSAAGPFFVNFPHFRRNSVENREEKGGSAREQTKSTLKFRPTRTDRCLFLWNAQVSAKRKLRVLALYFCARGVGHRLVS